MLYIASTRCIRFSTEVAGVSTLGTTGRGQQMEIGTYVDKVLDSELSGNIIDLCPVGALTSKPFAFTSRPWELLKTESIDVHDAVGSNIRIDTRGAEVMRILPRLNDAINEEWLADKSRFAYDGLKRQRLDTPLIKQKNEFITATWPEALSYVRDVIKSVKGEEIVGVAGELADAEAMIALKDFINKLGSNNTISSQYDTKLNADVRSDYLFNSTIAGIEESDCVLLIATNPRMEAPLVLSRIRKAVRQFDVEVGLIGVEADLAVPYTYLGNNSTTLADIVSGKHAWSALLKSAKKPAVILGMAALRRPDATAIVDAVTQLKRSIPNLSTPSWNGINYLHTAASRVAAQDIGFVPNHNSFNSAAKVVFLLNAEEINTNVVKLADKPFVIYIGHHGDAGAQQADVILPSPAYTEKAATYVNMEGRVQRTRVAVGRLAQARDDWQIIRALSELVGASLPYNSIEQLRSRLVDVAPHFANVDVIETPSFTPAANSNHNLESAPFASFFDNYWMTDPIARSSKTMARASKQLPTATNSYLQ